MNFLNDVNKWMKDAQKGCEKESEREEEIQPNRTFKMSLHLEKHKPHLSLNLLLQVLHA